MKTNRKSWEIDAVFQKPVSEGREISLAIQIPQLHDTFESLAGPKVLSELLQRAKLAGGSVKVRQTDRGGGIIVEAVRELSFHVVTLDRRRIVFQILECQATIDSALVRVLRLPVPAG